MADYAQPVSREVQPGAALLRQAYGLRIRSTLPMAELPPADGPEADIEIVEGPVPTELPGATDRGVRYQAAPGQLLLTVDGIARFLISEGRRIVIESPPGADPEDVRLFLYGSAFAALLHQRGDLVLHGSAIATGNSCVAFLGVSGIGKSTMAMACQRRGYPVLTDDVCAVRADASGRLLLHPGLPHAKLWLDSLKQFDLAPDGLRRIRQALEKRAVPLGETFATAPFPVRKLYILRATNEPDIQLTPVEGPQRLNALKQQTYRFHFVDGLAAKPAHFRAALALAQQATVTRVTRPEGIFRLAELVDRLEADFRP